MAEKKREIVGKQREIVGKHPHIQYTILFTPLMLFAVGENGFRLACLTSQGDGTMRLLGWKNCFRANKKTENKYKLISIFIFKKEWKPFRFRPVPCDHAAPTGLTVAG